MSKRAQPQNGEAPNSHESEPGHKRARVTEESSHPLPSDTVTNVPPSDQHTTTTVTSMLIENENASADSSSLNVLESSIPPATTAAIAGSSVAPKSAPSQVKRKGKKDFTGKVDRRGKRAREGWRAPRRDSEGEEGSNEKKGRLAKRKCAILIGFCGTDYSGMQMSVLLLSRQFGHFDYYTYLLTCIIS